MNLEADQQSKFTAKFEVRDQTNNNMIEAHQAFLRFTEVKSGNEIIYLAETSLNKAYTVEVDFSTNAKNFRHQSGAYLVDLVISDSLFENPATLRISEMNVKFAAQTSETKNSNLFVPKPEIKHLFRVPEVRPSQVVSLVFTFLCLMPLALVVILVMKIFNSKPKSAIIFNYFNF